MDIDFKESFEPSSREDWRQWLTEYHDQKQWVWLIFYKKHTGIRTLDYDDALEEAICFGWIDGLVRRVDGDRYTYRFTPRKKNSRWSPRNIAIAEEMIRTKKMAAAGKDAFEVRSEYEVQFNEMRASNAVELPEDILTQILSNPTAWHNFLNMSPSHRKNYILWITKAVQRSTRKKRIRETIDCLEQNLKPGM